MLPSTMAMLLGGPLAGTLDRSFGSKPALLAGAAFSAASYRLFAAAHSAPWQIYLGSALLGTGIGLYYAALANLTVAAVPQRHTGVATGINTIARTIGGGFGTQIVATLLAGRMIAGHPAESAFTLAFGVCALVLVLGIVAGLAIPGRRTADALVPVAVR